MKPLGFSAITPEESLSIFLQDFDLPVHLEVHSWDNAWRKISRMALYRVGPDVSQIGTTWLDSLVTLGALRAFTDADIQSLGGPSAFFPSSWQMASLPFAGSRIWAIPWLVDVRVIFYWRDMLEEAGVDEASAFQTPERVEETMASLRDGGIETPWGIWAIKVNVTFQNAASWIWGKGNDILSEDGKKILFDRPGAIEGFLSFFRLHRYMPPELDQLVTDNQAIDLFASRRVAAVMGPCVWFGKILDKVGQSSELAAKVGIASPPGPAFVGGSHLAIWQHTRRVDDACALVRFLTSKRMQLDYCHLTGFIPVRSDVLAESRYMKDARYQAMVEALRTGRSFPLVPRWGDVEEKLDYGLVWLWNTLLANPDQNLEALVKPYIKATARRLMVTLGIQP
jgi:multiple sugar transport system substrate-binding protein